VNAELVRGFAHILRTTRPRTHRSIRTQYAPSSTLGSTPESECSIASNLLAHFARPAVAAAPHRLAVTSEPENCETQTARVSNR
jgi:hypothetical protein